MSQNPKYSKKSTITLTVKGNYDKTGMITLPDEEGEMDLLALAASFHNMDVKITIRAEEVDEEE